MDWIIEKRLDEDVLTNEFEYFFSFLADRFEYATELWKNELEKKFGKRFKPVFVLSSKQNEFFPKENYIIINKISKEWQQKVKTDKIVCQEEQEDMNKYFSESSFINQILQKLVAKQGRVFILPWTTSFLNINCSNVIVLGPNPQISTKFDNKIEHIRLFEKLNIPRNKTKIYNSFEELREDVKYPFFISASYTSGGFENEIILTKEKLEEFYTHIRELNRSNKFLVANLISDVIHTPNVNAIVYGKNKTAIICISDQILRKCKYLGNIYPSKIREKQKEIIIESTKKIGDYLSNEGFRGLFGLDFIIDSKGNIFTTDLNPRRQGGYLCNVLMAFPKINLVELELKLALGEELSNNIDYNDFQVNYVWAHSKIKPYYDFMKIERCFKSGEVTDPFLKVGSEFKAIFYPRSYLFYGGCVGYVILSGFDYEQVKTSLITETEKILAKELKLHLI